MWPWYLVEDIVKGILLGIGAVVLLFWFVLCVWLLLVYFFHQVEAYDHYARLRRSLLDAAVKEAEKLERR